MGGGGESEEEEEGGGGGKISSVGYYAVELFIGFVIGVSCSILLAFG